MNRKILKRAAGAGLAGLALAIGGAQAQIRGDAPVDVAADLLEAQNSQGVVIYRGNVEAVQNTSRLRCSVLTIHFARRGDSNEFGDAERYVCEGPVWYITPREVARGNHATFHVGSSLITLTGDVVLRQDQNVASGDRLIVNTETNDSRLEANQPGSGPNRVRSVLYPDSAPGKPPAGR